MRKQLEEQKAIDMMEMLLQGIREVDNEVRHDMDKAEHITDVGYKRIHTIQESAKTRTFKKFHNTFVSTPIDGIWVEEDVNCEEAVNEMIDKYNDYMNACYKYI